MRRGPVALVATLGATLGLVVAACGSTEPAANDDTITVFAAASLTEAFSELGTNFEAEYPSAEVRFNFGASSQLAVQIGEGAPATVFAAADATTMTQALANLSSPPTPAVFTTNSAAIAVEPGNPKAIDSVDDLAANDVVVVVCAPEVPCGRYADEVFTRSRVDVQPASLEVNVKAVVSKVALGEADAGIVYTSDIVAADGRVDGVAIPPTTNIAAEYPIVALDPNDEVAAAFVDYVLSPAGQAILYTHGFGTDAESTS